MLLNVYQNSEDQDAVRVFQEYAETHPDAREILKREFLLVEADKETAEKNREYVDLMKRCNYRKNILRQYDNSIEFVSVIRAGINELKKRMAELDTSIASELGLDVSRYEKMKVRPNIQFKEVNAVSKDVLENSGTSRCGAMNENSQNEGNGEWISVLESLPPVGQNYRCLVGGFRYMGIPEYHIGFLAGSDGKGHLVWNLQDLSENDGIGHPEFHITHWKFIKSFPI